MKIFTRIIVPALFCLLCYTAAAKPVHTYGYAGSEESFSATNKQNGSYQNLQGVIVITANIAPAENSIPCTLRHAEAGKLPFGKTAAYLADTIINARKNIGQQYFIRCRYLHIGLKKPDIIFPFHYFL